MAIDLPTYDAVTALKTILSSEESLQSIDDLILATRAAKLQIEDEITVGSTTSQPELEDPKERESFGSLFEEISEVAALSKGTERTISQLTKDISYLDNAKRNLTQSTNLFQNLKLLSDSYFQCQHFLSLRDFKAMRAPFAVMSGLVSSFHQYKSVDEIGKLVARISRLQAETHTQIKKAFEGLLDQKSSQGDISDETVLREGACELLESSPGAKSELIDWCVRKMLYDIREIFQLDDEAGSLENLPRRYAYFKKVLNNFNAEFSRFFPKSWNLSLELTKGFYDTTASDLKVLLERELRDHPSIDLFMSSLQTTLEFEKYIDVKFSNRLHNEKGTEKISRCFEPYLTLWISHQEALMNSKILGYMAEDKLSQSSESLVLPSSADLFRTYRFLLTQTLELVDSGSGRDTILFELAKFFNTWLKTYYGKVLQPLLLPPGSKIENKEEATIYTLLVLNTADYCSTTTRQLVEKLSEYLTLENDISQLFDKVLSHYGALISSGMEIILNSIVAPDLNFIWREFDNTDWKSVEVEDYSRYMVTMKDILRDDQSTIRKIVGRFNREVYSWNFMDKLIELLFSGFLNCILRLLEPIPPFATLNKPRKLQLAQVINVGEQLQLDAEYMRQTLNFWTDDMASLINGSNASYKRLKKHIDQKCENLVKFLKLLVVPIDPPETYQENYAAITGNNKNILSWCYILTLKGFPWDLAEWKKLFAAFQNASGDFNASPLPVFEGCQRALLQFEQNMSSATDPTWRRFIHQELGMDTPNSVQSSSASSASPSSPTQRLNAGKFNGNIKNLMSNTGFFGRGN
ncbi:VPS53-like protein [Lachancea thermotolerans]